MRALLPKYEGKLRFQVLPAWTPEGKADVARFGLGSHGLVTLDVRGEVVGTLPGHDYGADVVLAKVEELLAAPR